jgi:uncharacterized protein
MERTALNYLRNWLTLVNRKPLVIRGARQVGKTWLVRYFAKISKRSLIELNLEKDPTHANLFTSNDVQQILSNLSARYNQKIDPKHHLLFLDEIQAVPGLFGKLRWFAEELPELPVIATGSLLEFVIAEPSFSMPVGRISYMHLEPLSFEEFLMASGKKPLHDYLTSYDLSFEMPLAIHDQLMTLFKEYLLVGGLPAVVLDWTQHRSLEHVNQIQHDLLATYRDDFSKYRGRTSTEKLDETISAIPKMLGQKFVFRQVSISAQANTIRQVLNLLEKARMAHRIQGCSANGVPLAAEIKEKYFKEIFLDVGLCGAALGLNLLQMNNTSEIIMINRGGIAEQVVGQMLRTINPPYIEPALYCWHREEPGSNAEIDYVIQHGDKVIPIEVKAGSTGSLKSLHLFMELKKSTFALRINSNLTSKVKIKLKGHTEGAVEYTLLSLPFYLVGQIYRLVQL